MTLLFSAPATSLPFTILAALHTWIFLGSTGQVDLFPLCYFCNVYLSPFWCGLTRLWWPLSSILLSRTIPLSTSNLDCRCFLVSFKMMASLFFVDCLGEFWEHYKNTELSLHAHREMRRLQLYPQESPWTSRT